jgi:hypothetical protein
VSLKSNEKCVKYLVHRFHKIYLYVRRQDSPPSSKRRKALTHALQNGSILSQAAKSMGGLYAVSKS